MSAAVKRAGGMWRIGPVVFDWSGISSVARCTLCAWTASSSSKPLQAVAREHAEAEGFEGAPLETVA